jgi:hypothetical protein
MRLRRDGEAWSVDGSWYRLSGRADAPVATLDDLDGRRWAELRLLASVDPRDADDETFSVVGPTVTDTADGIRLEWQLTGSVWADKRLVIVVTADVLRVHAEVSGSGQLREVSLLAGRVVQPRASGVVMSGAWFESVVSSGPGDPGRIVTPSAESASIGVVSGSEPGRGRWFFTPGPFVFATNRDVAPDPVTLPAGPWLAFGLDAIAGEAGFTEIAYRAIDRGFGFVLDYDGHTSVEGTWSSPDLVLARAEDPYAAIADQRNRLRTGEPASSASPVSTTGATQPASPAWWREPMFCGWGAQCADAASDGLPMSAAAGRATQARYDAWLDHLERRGIVPGTVVIDDRWQASYGTNEPDPDKWPDLRSWIAARHERGQRVLLWYKAWDAEGLPPTACVRTTSGVPIGLDPTSREGEAAIRDSVRIMLGSDGLAADGLKIDFTARTPSGRATTHHGPEWGVDLLRRLLEILAEEARRVRPDALLVAHSPNAIVAPFVGMIRLNDALRLDDPNPDVDIVPQMRYRAAIAAAACPDHLIDTDDWAVPDLATWRAYTAIKPELGVPALYFATHLDRTGERFEDRDYALIRETWATYRERAGLPQRRPSA